MLSTYKAIVTLNNLIEDNNEDKDILREVIAMIVPVPVRGTIVKANDNQDRFKPESIWVSNGDGTYIHLTGTKYLTANHNRLAGYTHTLFTP